MAVQDISRAERLVSTDLSSSDDAKSQITFDLLLSQKSLLKAGSSQLPVIRNVLATTFYYGEEKV